MDLVNGLKKVLSTCECDLEDKEMNKVMCKGLEIQMVNIRNIKNGKEKKKEEKKEEKKGEKKSALE